MMWRGGDYYREYLYRLVIIRMVQDKGDTLWYMTCASNVLYMEENMIDVGMLSRYVCHVANSALSCIWCNPRRSSQ